MRTEGLRQAAASLAAAALLSGCEWLQPFEQVCERKLGETAITVTPAPINERVDLSRSSAELTAMGAATAGHQVLGLAQTQLKWGVSYSSRGLTRRLGGRHCMRPDIEVKLAFDPMTILVAREQTEGSCAFNITMDHERKHVRIYERFLSRVAPQIEAELRSRIGNRILYFASEAEAEQHVQTSLKEYLAPMVDKSMQEVTALQAAIDTPEEYFRLETFQRACAS